MGKPGRKRIYAGDYAERRRAAQAVHRSKNLDRLRAVDRERQRLKRRAAGVGPRSKMPASERARRQREYRKSHPEVGTRSDRKYRDRNRDKVRKTQRESQARRRARMALASGPRIRRAIRRLGLHHGLKTLIRGLDITRRRFIRFRVAPTLAQIRARKALYRKADKLRRRSLKIQYTPIGDRSAYRAFVRQVRTATRMTCYWCRKPVPKGQRHLDHIIALAAGGPDDVHNLCCACGPCNATKNKKLPEEFSGQGVLRFV